MAAKPNLAAIAPVPLDVAWLLPAVLSTTAGAVDVIGFLALGGLFAAHITGNLVVLASHYLTGGFSQIGPLLSVPVFPDTKEETLGSIVRFTYFRKKTELFAKEF